MTADQIIKKLRSKDFAPIYFLAGEEAYHIDKVISYAENNILEEAERAFNQSVLYGKESNFKQVVDNARQYPMMASHRLVILKEAQSMRDFEMLEEYIKKPSPQCLLFISYKHKKPDGRKAIFKLLKKNSVYLDSAKIKDYKLSEWIFNYVKDRGFTIKNPTAALLAEYLGNNLQKIENEISKATINLESGQELSAQLVQDKIGISKEYNVFELQKALGLKKITQINRIADNMARNMKNNPMPLLIASLFRYFNQLFIAAQNNSSSDQQLASLLRINPYFIKEIKLAARQYSAGQYYKIFKLLRDFDLRSKGLNSRNTPGEELFREMIAKMVSA